MNIGRAARWLMLVVAAFVAIQFVPYGRHGEPRRAAHEPAWASTRTRELTARACFDCHSNQTAWPWYAGVAPARWIVYRDVTAGRAVLNFSEFDVPQPDVRHAAEAVRARQMPPRSYLLLRRSARLTSDERAALAQGFEAFRSVDDADLAKPETLGTAPAPFLEE